MMPGVLAVVDLDIRDAALLLILFSANEFVTDLPGGLIHHQFPSMANYTIFTLGILLLFLSFFFPRESVAQVAKKLFCLAAEHCRLSLDAAARAGSLGGDISYMILGKMKKMLKVLVLISTVAVFGIVAYLAVCLPCLPHKLRTLSVTNLGTLIMGISLLVPVLVVLSNNLVSTAAGFGRLFLGLSVSDFARQLSDCFTFQSDFARQQEGTGSSVGRPVSSGEREVL